MDNDAIPFHSHSPPPFDEQQAVSDDDDEDEFGDFSEFNQSELSACAVNLSIPEHNFADLSSTGVTGHDEDGGGHGDGGHDGSGAQMERHLENSVDSQVKDDDDVREGKMAAEETAIVRLELTPYPVDDDATIPRAMDDGETTPQSAEDEGTSLQLLSDEETTPRSAVDVETTPQAAVDVEMTPQLVAGEELMIAELVFDVDMSPQSAASAETTPASAVDVEPAIDVVTVGESAVDVVATRESTADVVTAGVSAVDVVATRESTADVVTAGESTVDVEEATFAVHFATTSGQAFKVVLPPLDDAPSDAELPSSSSSAAAGFSDSGDDQEWASFAPPPVPTTGQGDSEEEEDAWAEWGTPGKVVTTAEPDDGDDWPEEEEWAAPMQTPAPVAPAPPASADASAAPSQQPAASTADMKAFFPIPADADSGDRSCVDLDSCLLWEQLNSEEALNALAVDWLKTSCFRLLLKALAIDEKSVMHPQSAGTGILQPMVLQPSVVKRATDDEQQRPLGSASPPLLPQQQAAMPSGGAGTGGGGAASGDLALKERSGSELSQLSFDESKIEFDWSNSGLTNPLAGPPGSSLDLDFFTVDSSMMSSSPIDDPLLRELESATTPSTTTTTTVPQQQQQQRGVQSSTFTVDAILAQIGKRSTMTSPFLSSSLLSHESASAAASIAGGGGGGGIGGAEFVKEEELCEEARRILEQLPDLSFLLSAVLMFPLHQTSDTTE